MEISILHLKLYIFNPMNYFYLMGDYVFYNNVLLYGTIIIVGIALSLFILDCIVSHNFRIRTVLIKFLGSMLRNKMFIVLLLTALLFAFEFVSLMNKTFNGGKWGFFCFTSISKDIGDWGDFATCIGVFFALISVLLAYLAFKSQVNATKRTSFDATFTQIFAQHHVLHEKVIQHNIGFISIYNLSFVTNSLDNNIFTICKNEFQKNVIGILPISVSNFWRHFNQWSIQESVSIDFKNYFKYIYHEINIVVNQPYEVLDDDAKRRYIQLIQAQMNYDELFCYLLNQVEYLNYRTIHKKTNEIAFNAAIAHAENLRNYGFFYELCKSRSGHNALVRNIMMYNKDEVSRLIRNEWLP